MSIQLRKASFRKWLREKQPWAVVGYGCRAGECPLANFLKHQGAPEPSVTRSNYFRDVSGGEEPTRTPAWCRPFIRAVDCHDVPTAALCLQLLEQANA